MKRDMELVRELMLVIESQDGDFNYESIEASRYDESQIEYHLGLLIEAKLVDGEVYPQMAGRRPVIRVKRLSWNGHEFLDNARNEPVWKEAMKQVREKGEGISIALLTQLLIAETKRLFGLG